MKRFLLILGIILFTTNLCYSDNYDNDGYVGTPPGFYDDINPNDLEETNSQSAKQTEIPKNTQEFQQIYDGEDVIVPPQKTKSTKNYAEIYANLEVPTFSYLHNIDPDQYYDTKDATWSVYPLIRLNSYIYFKNIAIEPGYYLLTPREHNGDWFILFKQNGIVKYIVPVYDRDYTPATFYDEHIPKPKLKTAQKIHMGVLDFLGNFKNTKRKTPIKSYLEVNDLENYFVSIIIYYGSHKYSTIFRTIKL